MRKACLLGALLIVGGFAGRAQADERLIVTVPFDFVVRGAQMPAGRYEVIEDGGDPAVLLIRNENGKEATFVLSSAMSGHDPAGNHPALVFSRVERRLVLSQVWEGDNSGRQVAE